MPRGRRFRLLELGPLYAFTKAGISAATTQLSLMLLYVMVLLACWNGAVAFAGVKPCAESTPDEGTHAVSKAGQMLLNAAVYLFFHHLGQQHMRSASPSTHGRVFPFDVCMSPAAALALLESQEL